MIVVWFVYIELVGGGGEVGGELFELLVETDLEDSEVLLELLDADALLGRLLVWSHLG